MTTRCPTRPRVWLRAVALAVCSLVVVSSALPLFAAPAGSGDDSVTLTADRVEYNSQTRQVRADGHARATGRGAVITADHLEADLAAQEIVARGNVTLAQGDKTITASVLRYNLATRTGHVEQAAGQLNIWHVSADAIDVAPEQDVAAGASITPCDPDHPAYKVTAKKIVITPGQFTAYDASLWVAGIRVITVPVYTARSDKRSGPTLGYNTLDGAYLEYANAFFTGGWRDDYRIRLATANGLSAENVLTQRFGHTTVGIDLGRTQVRNPEGIFLNLDRYAVDVAYDRQRIPAARFDVEFEGHAGSYTEIARGVSTTRADAILTFATDTFVLRPGLYFSAGSRVHYDAYGTGQQRTVIEGSTALTAILNPRASTTLSYSTVGVNGATPFTFDSYDPSSVASLSYTQVFGGFLQSATASLTQDFLAQQTTLGLTASMSISPDVAFNIYAQYNLSTQQLVEVDYAVNVRCDCVSVGLVYQTFPNSPASNNLMLSIQLNAFPGQGFTFSGSGVKSQ
jgi:lipopolysaccharide assembly outer membrane protein LptD (OstA)